VRIFLTIALSALLAASPVAHALPDELEVRLGEINKPGQLGFDVMANYTVSGPRKSADDGLRSSFHLLQISPTLSYGMTEDTQVGFQLFSSLGAHGEARVDGGRIEFLALPVRPEDDDDDGLFFGGLLGVGHLPATLSNNHLDAEIKMILGYRAGRWTFATNPDVGVKISGKGSAEPDFSVKFKVAYRVGHRYSIGVEHYGDLGRLRHIDPPNQHSQQTFAVVDLKAEGMEFNVGIGRGLNDFSERWAVKTIVSFPFGK
jgi:long-subunit fatty acid transport protein